jgi:hypothetical protein
MSDWVVNLPMRHRSEPIDADALSDLPRALPKGPERDMARQLLLESRLDAGMSTVGEVADWLGGLDGPGRRRVLDRLRGHVGLPSTGDVEAERRSEALNRNARAIASSESPWQVCPADGCGEIPVNELGSPIPVDVRRWWCPAHRHLAGEGDLERRPPRLRYSPSGAIIEVDEDEQAREHAVHESRRRGLEAKLAERQAEAAERNAREQAKREQLDRELPPGFPR